MSNTAGPHTVKRPCAICGKRRRRYPDEISAKLAASPSPTTKRNRWVIIPCGPAWHVVQHGG